jgi:hypothetical protein
MRAVSKNIFRLIFVCVFTFVAFTSPVVAAKAMLIDIEVIAAGAMSGANIAFVLTGKAQSEGFTDSNNNLALHNKGLFLYTIPEKSTIPLRHFTRHFNITKPNALFAKDSFDAICEQASTISHIALITEYAVLSSPWFADYKYFLPNTRDRPV